MSRLEKTGGYENMGVNPEETPLRPNNERDQENAQIVFEQNYFKD